MSHFQIGRGSTLDKSSIKARVSDSALNASDLQLDDDFIPDISYLPLSSLWLQGDEEFVYTEPPEEWLTSLKGYKKTTNSEINQLSSQDPSNSSRSTQKSNRIYYHRNTTAGSCATGHLSFSNVPNDNLFFQLHTAVWPLRVNFVKKQWNSPAEKDIVAQTKDGHLYHKGKKLIKIPSNPKLSFFRPAFAAGTRAREKKNIVYSQRVLWILTRNQRIF